MADRTRNSTDRILVNEDYDTAAIFFDDGSCLRFEHTSRQNRWARASSAHTRADEICRRMTQFRLNAKHLQLYFDDGSDADFSMRAETNGATLG